MSVSFLPVESSDGLGMSEGLSLTWDYERGVGSVVVMGERHVVPQGFISQRGVQMVEVRVRQGGGGGGGGGG